MFDDCHNKNNTLRTIRRLLAQILKTFEVKRFYINSVNKQPYAYVWDIIVVCIINYLLYNRVYTSSYNNNCFKFYFS